MANDSEVLTRLLDVHARLVRAERVIDDLRTVLRIPGEAPLVETARAIREDLDRYAHAEQEEVP